MDSVGKNKRSKKLFKYCFRATADGVVKPDRTYGSGDPAFAYIPVKIKAEEKKMVLPDVLSSLSEENSRAFSDEGDAGVRRERSRGGFSRVFKAVLFETSLAKKVRKRKAREKSNSAKSNGKSSKANSISEFPESSDGSIYSSRWSSRNSSSNSSSTIASTSLRFSRASSVASSSVTSRCSSERKASFPASLIEPKQVDRPASTVNRLASTENAKGRHSSNIGLCLILVCLLVLISGGKVYAILCTSAFCFLVPNRVRMVDLPGSGVDSSDVDSLEHKKRVIMGGLLQRNRNRML